MKYFLKVNDKGLCVSCATVRSSSDEIEINASDDLICNFNRYKAVNNRIIKMTDEEFNRLYPNCIDNYSNEEIQNDFNLNVDYRLSCLELGL